jgi:hypothetical protein
MQSIRCLQFYLSHHEALFIAVCDAAQRGRLCELEWVESKVIVVTGGWPLVLHRILSPERGAHISPGQANLRASPRVADKMDGFALKGNAVNALSLSIGRPTTPVSCYAGGISVISRWLSEATPPGSIAAAIFES